MATYVDYQGSATKFNPGVYVRTNLATSWPDAGAEFLVAAAINGAPVWPSFSFASGVVGVAYSQDFDLSPALSPTTYTLQSGTLPPGLSLSNLTADKGRLSGTPTTVGSFTFTLRATNSLGYSDSAFTITIGSTGGYSYAWVC